MMRLRRDLIDEVGCRTSSDAAEWRLIVKLLRAFDDNAGYRGGVLAIGNFDGVHCGHQQMFAALTRQARERQVPSVVLTFEPHPIEVLRPQEAPPRLTTTEQKAELIADCGVDFLIVYQTDLRLLNLSPDDFFESVVRGEVAASGLVEGPNFFFGRNRAGNIKVLEQLCRRDNLTLEIVPPVFVGAQMASSSAVRDAVARGEVDQANDLLGHRYTVRGLVVKGSVRGRTLGFPTANVTHIATVLPCEGVYAGLVHHNGKGWPAAINLGPNPTFGERRRKFEAHLLGFEGDLYDQSLDIELIQRLRDTRPFANVDELKAQLQADIRNVEAIVKAG